MAAVQAVAEVQQVAVPEDLAEAADTAVVEQRESSSPQEPPPPPPPAPPSLEDGELLGGGWAPGLWLSPCACVGCA